MRGGAGPAHLRVDVRVDAQQHFDGLAHSARRSRDVVQVKLGVDVDEHALAHRQLELPRQLSVAVQDGPAEQAHCIASGSGRL